MLLRRMPSAVESSWPRSELSGVSVRPDGSERDVRGDWEPVAGGQAGARFQSQEIIRRHLQSHRHGTRLSS